MAFSLNKLFTPKDRVFYGLFEDSTNNLVEMGAAFVAALAIADKEKRNVALRTLDDLEHRNDEVTHRIFIELGRNFIAPFDREDIHTLATALDDVADYIYASAKKLNFYRVNPNDIGIQKMAELIEQGTVHIKSAVDEMRN